MTESKGCPEINANGVRCLGFEGNEPHYGDDAEGRRVYWPGERMTQRSTEIIERSAHEVPTPRQTIWREGERIRSTDGTGYADRVSDDHIREHIDAHTSTDLGDPTFVPFAEAVLAIRTFERKASDA